MEYNVIVFIIKEDNAELRADVKFLMDQNVLLIEHMTKNSVNSQANSREVTFQAEKNDQSLIPEVSDLITSVSQMAFQNSELLKMAQSHGNFQQ